MLIASSSSASGAYGMGSMLIWIVVMIAMFYFLLIRPQKKEQKKVQAMLSEMAVGDAVVTTGGFYGIIIDITEAHLGVKHRLPHLLGRLGDGVASQINPFSLCLHQNDLPLDILSSNQWDLSRPSIDKLY